MRTIVEIKDIVRTLLDQGTEELLDKSGGNISTVILQHVVNFKSAVIECYYTDI